MNILDQTCKQQELFYSQFTCTKNRIKADDTLAREATIISLDESNSQYEKNDARLVTGIIRL